MNDNLIPSDDRHREVFAVLPWYANGTLKEAECEAVEAHLAQCAECRASLVCEQAIVADLPGAAPLPDIDAGWAAMLTRLHDEPEAATDHALGDGVGNVVSRTDPSFWRRPVPLGWAIAAQAAAVVLIVGSMQLARTPDTAEHEYHALSSDTRVTDANLLVMFRADLREGDLRRLLLANRATLVGGPNASGAYQLNVAPGQLDTAIGHLRADPRVTMAEPIDGGGQ